MRILEYLHKRDLHFNDRFRGYGMKAYDQDLFLFHSKTKEVVCSLEFKHGEISSIDMMSDEIVCLRKVADKLGVPLLVIAYFIRGMDGFLLQADDEKEIDSIDVFMVPGNPLAFKNCLSGPKLMSELSMVEIFYKLEGEPKPKNSIKLFDTITTEFVPTIKNLLAV